MCWNGDGFKNSKSLEEYQMEDLYWIDKLPRFTPFGINLLRGWVKDNHF